jgi:phytoene dehydrogenase-like protein
MSLADALTNHSEADVLVVRAGFAGVAAARELRREGLAPIVLEARGRIGGRTWFEERMGTTLELGGTWIHPFQPNVWSEVRLFGSGVVESPIPTTARWIVGNRLHEGPPEELSNLLDEPMRRFAVDAREVFPRPFEPLFAADRVRELDHLSVEDRFARLHFTPQQHDQMRAA